VSASSTGSAGAAPFAQGTVLALLVVGAALFIGLLWYLGHAGPPANNGGGHAGGVGSTAMPRWRRWPARTAIPWRRRAARAAWSARRAGADPLAGTDGKDIDRIVSKRRRIGPTVVIASKWDAKLLERKEQRPRGWTRIEGVSLPQWRGFADDVTVTLSGLKPGLAKGWDHR
jgi:hypothetical protein